jgi:ATP-dependent Clp protease protease subunit
MDEHSANAQELYATLCGRVDDAMTQRVFNRLVDAINSGVKTLHLLIQSSGGIIGEGIALHNFLKNMPIDIVAYNGGSIQSIAVIAFLGAKRRMASKSATFMMHKATFNPGRASTSFQLNAATQSLMVDDDRIENILRQHIVMPEEKWNVHRFADLFITADDALEYGLIDEIADFAPPANARMINI